MGGTAFFSVDTTAEGRQEEEHAMTKIRIARVGAALLGLAGVWLVAGAPVWQPF
jgi:hypothetical protein